MPVEVIAYIDGEIVEIIENEGVVVETTASFIQGIFGVGGEVIGKLKVMVNSPEEELTPEKIEGDLKDKIIVGGSFVTKEAIDEAKKKGAKGIVVGGIDDINLKKFLGYDIGVAITGSENTGLTLIITEGFGKMKMAKRTFELLLELDGKKASCNGATQIRAGVIRPEIIVPLDEKVMIKEEEESLKEGMNVGTVVRIIREPYFGKIGKVKSLPPELREIETESKVRVVEVELENGEVIIIPRANVEIIEE
jgi:transcription antitermination factor NusG